MAEAATTRPARKRATPVAASKPAAKAATPKAAPAAPAVMTSEDGLTKIGFTLEKQADTKSYAKFTPPASSGCVGSLYVPLGTLEVKVLLIGPTGE